ncbi:hypothetical protein Psyc_1028 [Psychrobacter arcticus 273-4]|uniref:KilA-N domain-containing protein n=1 Tax=Psychrobacter arcticus (strain DSM 17307 / VKM B-2377 / 273-4) TaxID=259536 RepID=Q4FSX7_PSYA2|nr:KilA-N domain-containing protein [Psychrobacter arcticus]AAZ18881.1 hypothetical protein Psyc_1028 [Psychrobacter arcticus 273-4]
MTSLTVYAPQITILDHIVSTIDGLYSLNDLHKASGGRVKHKPAFFLRNEQTKEIVTELQICNSPEEVLRVQRGGTNQGTWVCKELVYSYAMWISAKFHIAVVRTFDALITRTDAKQRESLVAACDKLAIGNTLRSEVYTIVANHFGYEKVTQIPAPLLPEAVAFVYEMILARQKPVKTVSDGVLMNNRMWNDVGFVKTEQMCWMTKDLSTLLAQVSEKVSEIKRAQNTIFDSFNEQKWNGLTPEQLERVDKQGKLFL